MRLLPAKYSQRNLAGGELDTLLGPWFSIDPCLLQGTLTPRSLYLSLEYMIMIGSVTGVRSTAAVLTLRDRIVPEYNLPTYLGTRRNPHPPSLALTLLAPHSTAKQTCGLRTSTPSRAPRTTFPVPPQVQASILRERR